MAPGVQIIDPITFVETIYKQTKSQKVDEFEDKRTNCDTLNLNFSNNSGQILKKLINNLF